MPVEVGLVAEHLVTVSACCLSCVTLHVVAQSGPVLETLSTC